MAFRDFAQSGELGDRAQRWADVMLFGPSGFEGPLPYSLRFGVRGVGLLRRTGKDVIVLLMALPPNTTEVRLDETSLNDPENEPGVTDAIKQAGGDPFDEVKILRIPQLIQNAVAGTAIYAARQGTAGPEARWANGRRGFLTAGHVAIGTSHVDDAAGVHLGKTICAFDPGTVSGGTRPNIDVALVEVSSTAKTTRLTMGTPLSGGANVDLHLAKGLTSSSVVAMAAWYLWPGLGATYVDLYLTNAACTLPGDSGAAVTPAGGKEVVGLVVGGTKTFTSYIQDIGRQAAMLRTVAGLSAIAL